MEINFYVMILQPSEVRDDRWLKLKGERPYFIIMLTSGEITTCRPLTLNRR